MEAADELQQVLREKRLMRPENGKGYPSTDDHASFKGYGRRCPDIKEGFTRWI